MTILAAPGQNAELLNKAAVKGRSLWDDSLRRLLANKAAIAGFVVLGLLTLIAVVGPFVWPHKFDTQYQDQLRIGPSLESMHWLGTDIYGRDMVARVITGLQISLAVGLIATLVSLIIGVAWGAIAGFAGGRVDQFMMRIVDVLYAVPFIFFVILVTVVFGRSIFLIFLAEAEGIRRSRPRRRRQTNRHRRPPHPAEPAGPRGGLRHAHHAGRHPSGKLPLLHRPRRERTADVARPPHL